MNTNKEDLAKVVPGEWKCDPRRGHALWHLTRDDTHFVVDKQPCESWLASAFSLTTHGFKAEASAPTAAAALLALKQGMASTIREMGAAVLRATQCRSHTVIDGVGQFN